MNPDLHAVPPVPAGYTFCGCQPEPGGGRQWPRWQAHWQVETTTGCHGIRVTLPLSMFNASREAAEAAALAMGAPEWKPTKFRRVNGRIVAE